MAKTPVPAKAPALPQTEIAELAKTARLAWGLGEPVSHVDSLGMLWDFEPVRDVSSRLVIRRSEPFADGEPAKLLASGQISQIDLNRDDTNAVIAATLNAISEPA